MSNPFFYCTAGIIIVKKKKVGARPSDLQMLCPMVRIEQPNFCLYL